MKNKWMVIVVCVMLLGGLAYGLFAAPSTVQANAEQGMAAQRTPIPLQQTLVSVRETLAALPTQQPADLENLLAREKLAESNQKTRLTLSHTVASAVQSFIDTQKSAGKDTAALETALSAFNQAISSAETENAAAASLLAAQAGFDASGHVTDRATARETVHSAGQSLRQAHLILTQATLTLRKAVKTYLGK